MIAMALDGGGGVVWDSDLLVERFHLQSSDGGTFKSFSFSPDSSRIVTGSSRMVQLWDAQTGRELLTLGDLRTDVNSVAFSPDGRTIAAGFHDGSIRLWELPSEEKIEQWLREDLGG